MPHQCKALQACLRGVQCGLGVGCSIRVQSNSLPPACWVRRGLFGVGEWWWGPWGLAVALISMHPQLSHAVLTGRELYGLLFLALLTQLISSGIFQGYLCFSLYLAAKLFFSDWLLMKNKSIYPHQLNYKYRENRVKMSPHGDGFTFFHSLNRGLCKLRKIFIKNAGHSNPLF